MDRLIDNYQSIDSYELEDLGSKLRSFKFKKSQADRKPRRALINHEASVLKLRNQVHSYLWNLVNPQAHQSSNQSASELASENTAILNLINSSIENRPNINYNMTGDTDLCRNELPHLLLQNQMCFEEVEVNRTTVLEPEEKDEGAFMRFIRQLKLKKVIAGLQGSRASNNLKIQHLVGQLAQKKSQSAKEESFFSNGSTLASRTMHFESLFDNEVPEKGVLYNLKSFFKIESRYIQLQEQRMKVSSNRKIIEYNSGSCLIRGQRQPKLQSLQRRDRLPGVQLGRLL